MKANEAPEKIYIPTILAANTVRYKEEGSIEYTRTDAFIEKAKAWFIEHINVSQEVAVNEDGEPLADSYIKYAESRLNAANEIFEDFIKYVKGK